MAGMCLALEILRSKENNVQRSNTKLVHIAY